MVHRNAMDGMPTKPLRHMLAAGGDHKCIERKFPVIEAAVLDSFSVGARISGELLLRGKPTA